ncbi:NUDIX hydrolase [Fictibacillus fluitans]|uniref:NUDIX domain-containing protein n=1 Tax=Fictibacillus fluitans TaxID=3058422 RepID=A0ABT8HXG7_9BACL|nr:NUDIX domain-containing protein [Fictibacillus sp. NE201]MDN4525170.1 NUDIX domain-containing protein [Fictibacillus sp. NE201]
MNSEVVRIFDEQMKCIGQKTREDVHRDGVWHETFHCWFTLLEGSERYILLQKRAEVKKDYPCLLDITSAGHLMADERVHDGTREIEEELGVSVTFEELIPLSIIKTEIKQDTMWDREFCHVFLYPCDQLPAFSLQKEEVDAIYKIKLQDGIDLFKGKAQDIEVLEVHPGQQTKRVNKADFVDQVDYYRDVFERIQETVK